MYSVTYSDEALASIAKFKRSNPASFKKITKFIEELPNDLVRRNPAKYTAQYINRLMSLVDGWERSEQEKVKGLHPSFCDKTGRAKHPWVRISVQQEEQKGKEENWLSELPF